MAAMSVTAAASKPASVQARAIDSTVACGTDE
jgi:hypothetical protein